jgi:hypothetical protein
MSSANERFRDRVALPLTAVGLLALGTEIVTSDKFAEDRGCAIAEVPQNGGLSNAAWESARELGLPTDTDPTIGYSINHAANFALSKMQESGDFEVHMGNEVNTCFTFSPLNIIDPWDVTITSVSQ